MASLSLLPLSYVADWWGSAEALALHALSAKGSRKSPHH